MHSGHQQQFSVNEIGVKIQELLPSSCLATDDTQSSGALYRRATGELRKWSHFHEFSSTRLLPDSGLQDHNQIQREDSRRYTARHTELHMCLSHAFFVRGNGFAGIGVSTGDNTPKGAKRSLCWNPCFGMLPTGSRLREQHRCKEWRELSRITIRFINNERLRWLSLNVDGYFVKLAEDIELDSSARPSFCRVFLILSLLWLA